MKKLKIAIVALVLVTITAGIIYTISKRRSNVDAVSNNAYDQQVRFHEARVKNYPEDSGSHVKLASALMARAQAIGDGSDYDRALEVLAIAEKLDPGSLEPPLARAVALLSRHRFAEARNLAERVLKRAPDNPGLIGIAGDAALQTGDPDGAERHYQRLVEHESKKASTWTRMSQLAEMRGNLEEAAKLMEKAIDAGYPRPLSPANFAWARSMLGEIEAKRGNLDAARFQYKWALDKSPGHPLAMEFLADLEQWRGNNQEAEKLYRELMARHATPSIQIKLANLLEKRGATNEAAPLRTEARRFYEKAVASGNEGYLRELATLELSAGNYRRAADLAARDMELRPTAESRAIYANILKAANDAGQSLDVAQK